MTLAAIGKSGEGRQVMPIAPLRVLVVDDNRDGADALGCWGRLGHQVHVTYGGITALEVARVFQPASFLIAAGPWLSRLGLTNTGAAAASHWLVVLVALLASFSIAYNFGTHALKKWEWITPGSTIGVIVRVAVNLGFRVYLLHGPGLARPTEPLPGSS